MNSKTLTANFFKDSLYYLFANVIPMIIGIISVPVYSIIFELGEYGEYTIINTTIAFANVFTVSWLVMCLLRFYSKYKNENRERVLISSSFLTMLACICLVYLAAIVVYAAARSHVDDSRILLYILGGLNILSLGLFTLVKAIFQAERKTRQFTIYSAVYSIIRIALIVPAVIGLRMGIYAIFIVDLVLELVLTAIILKRYGYLEKIKPGYVSFAEIRKIAAYGLPLIGVLVSHLALSLTDRYMILYFKNKAEVGLYSMNYSIAEKTLVILVNVLLHAATPIVFQQWENNRSEKDTGELMEKLIKLYTCIMLPAATGLSLLSKDIARLFLSAKYHDGYGVMSYIAFSVFFLGLIQCQNKALEIFQKSKSMMAVTLCMTLLNVVLNALLIPPLGYIGAAIATLASYAVYFIVSYILSQRFLRVKSDISGMIKILLCNMAMILIIILLDNAMSSGIASFVIKTASGALFYCLLLYFSGVVKEETDLVKGRFIKQKA